MTAAEGSSDLPIRRSRARTHTLEQTEPILAVGAAFDDAELPHTTGEPPAVAWVTFTAPDGGSQRHDLDDTTSVGRHTDNDIQLLDPEVSKHHLVIERQSPRRFTFTDLGSANGTLVNGVESRKAELEAGDILLVGNTEVTFHLELKKKVRVPDATHTSLSETGDESSSPFDEMLGLDPDKTPSCAMIPIGWPKGKYGRPTRRSIDECFFVDEVPAKTN